MNRTNSKIVRNLNGGDRLYTEKQVFDLYAHLCAKAIEEIAGSK